MTIAYLNYDENTLESHPMQKPAKEFINKEAIGGLVLIGATILHPCPYHQQCWFQHIL
jgi:hypothetical protein